MYFVMKIIATVVISVMMQAGTESIVATTPREAVVDFMEGLENRDTYVMEKYMDDSYVNFITNVQGDEAVVERMNDALDVYERQHLGYLKRIPADTYKTQKRGGKGITGLTTRENDFVSDLIMTSTHDNLMFFTNTGKVHRIKAYEIPEATRTARGTPAINFLNLMQRERITAVIPFRDFRDDKYLMAVTKDGTIKKTAISQFDTNRKTGLIAINLKDGDELVDIKQTSGDDNVIIITKNGKCICFSEDDVRPMGRIAGGVRAIKLEDDDEVISMELVQPHEELLVVTSKGYGKRTPVKDYKIPVSYTHLDVYKRQGWRKERIIFIACGTGILRYAGEKTKRGYGEQKHRKRPSQGRP